MQNNTFQVVLGDDGESSFVLFLYEDGGIQWTTANGNSGGTDGMFCNFEFVRPHKVEY